MITVGEALSGVVAIVIEIIKQLQLLLGINHSLYTLHLIPHLIGLPALFHNL